MAICKGLQGLITDKFDLIFMTAVKEHRILPKANVKPTYQSKEG